MKEEEKRESSTTICSREPLDINDLDLHALSWVDCRVLLGFVSVYCGRCQSLERLREPIIKFPILCSFWLLSSKVVIDIRRHGHDQKKGLAYLISVSLS